MAKRSGFGEDKLGRGKDGGFCRGIRARWLPDTAYFSRFEDSDFYPIADFGDVLDATRTLLPGGCRRESTWRSGNRDR
jgi:hypothetical protein